MCCHSVVLSIYSGADEEGFKNGEAGYSSLSVCSRQAKHTEKSRTNPWVSLFVLFFFIVIIRRSRARTCSGGFWTTFRHFSESFLNSSHVCALWLAGAPVQSGRSLLIWGSDVTARVLDVISVIFSTFKSSQRCFSPVSHFAHVMSLSCSADFRLSVISLKKCWSIRVCSWPCLHFITHYSVMNQ